MARGGYRPGAGRPRLSAEEKAARAADTAAGKVAAPVPNRPPRKAVVRHAAADAVPPVDTPAEVAAEAKVANKTPLDYMLTVMNDASIDAARRDRMAVAAAPFMHPRKEPVGQGKKESTAEQAKKAAGGRFAPKKAPLKLVG